MELRKFDSFEHYSDYINHAVWCSQVIDTALKMSEPCTHNELRIKRVAGDEMFKSMMERFERTFYSR